MVWRSLSLFPLFSILFFWISFSRFFSNDKDDYLDWMKKIHMCSLELYKAVLIFLCSKLVFWRGSWFTGRVYLVVKPGSIWLLLFLERPLMGEDIPGLENASNIRHKTTQQKNNYKRSRRIFGRLINLCPFPRASCPFCEFRTKLPRGPRSSFSHQNSRDKPSKRRKCDTKTYGMIHRMRFLRTNTFDVKEFVIACQDDAAAYRGSAECRGNVMTSGISLALTFPVSWKKWLQHLKK